MNVLKKIRTLLDKHEIKYDYMQHEPTVTSEESSRARGCSMEQGAKALVFKADDDYIQLICPANLRIDSKKFKKQFGYKKMSMVDLDVLEELTTCKKGAVPPFGNLFEFKVFVDQRLAENEIIAFNAGTRTDSIMMKYTDWEDLVKPVVSNFTK